MPDTYRKNELMIPILSYDNPEGRDFLKRLGERGGFEDESVLNTVKGILRKVRDAGDAALLELTRRFDAPEMTSDQLSVTPEEIERAYAHVTAEFLDAVRLAHENIRRFHEKQVRTSWMTAEEGGVVLGQLHFPLERIGIHCPAVSQLLFSSLMMCAIPAQVAGVREIVACIPPTRNGRIHPAMLVAARECGIGEVYACGGAQAVAAMAYGTATIRRVDKIVGPGNLYVQLAKKEVVGYVDIDKLAGPSEVLIIADDSATPAFIAADLISQAEHGGHSSAVLITTSREIADKVCAELTEQVAALSRNDEIKASFGKYGGCLLVDDLPTAVVVTNQVAPEHAEVHTRDALQIAVQLRNAGAVFVGEYTPEAVGDYAAGPSHVLPTGGTARFYSSMSADDFVKRTNLLVYTRAALDAVTDAVVTLARAEGLDGHGAAMTVRRSSRR